VLQVVPSLLADALDTPGETDLALAGLRWLNITGEAAPPALCRRWLTLHPGIPLLNSYGPTECSDNVTHHVIAEPPPAGAARVPIGRPIGNIRIYVVDPALSPVPIGVTGELCVGGVGVGRGYLNDPERTAEAFRRDPFVTDPEARLYRTGDLARWRSDGTLDFLGRRDHQIKVRGHRIEPGEIEAALLGVPGVKEAVVAAWSAGGDGRLVAWLVESSPEARPADGALREMLRATLPGYMVPELFVTLAAMPRSPNGKIDRRALPAPDLSRASRPAGADLGARRTPVEAKLTEIWAEVLGLDAIDSQDDFFELGGHSLLATKVIARVRRAFQVDVPLRAFFQSSTLAALAKLIQEMQ
jgi:acyl-coenzyme A synthetase/AMP-(fatty) acid ligase/acyl carrier protein